MFISLEKKEKEQQKEKRLFSSMERDMSDGVVDLCVYQRLLYQSVLNCSETFEVKNIVLQRILVVVLNIW
jgi:hypothetical protein